MNRYLILKEDTEIFNSSVIVKKGKHLITHEGNLSFSIPNDVTSKGRLSLSKSLEGKLYDIVWDFSLKELTNNQQ